MKQILQLGQKVTTITHTIQYVHRHTCRVLHLEKTFTVSIGIGGTIGGILVILVPIVIGCIWCIRRYKQERREYRLEEEENRYVYMTCEL